MSKFKEWIKDKENQDYLDGLEHLIILVIAAFMLVFMISLVWRVFGDYEELVSRIYNVFETINNSIHEYQ